MKPDAYKRSRTLYIAEATLEYLISILVAGTYLATITKVLGISDTLTGIISAFISLGCVFQLCGIFLPRTNSKKTVLLFSVLNQLLFMALYVLPLADGNKKWGTAAFIVLILLAYFFYNIVHPKKIDWLIGLVDDDKRGVFTAKKEMVSLVAGMAFSFLMGAIVDYYKAAGNLRVAFVICAVAIFILMALHTLSLAFTCEKTHEQTTPAPSRGRLFAALKDKRILRITLVFVLWHVATYCATPFYGTYQIIELGFTQVFVAILNLIYAVARISFSFMWGQYADKQSFAKMLRLCFGVAALGFLCNVFCVPQNGRVLYTLYYTLNAIAMGGINSALTNLCFDYVNDDKRADALAVSLAVSGVCGFLSTLAVSPLVTYIQSNGNTLFGLSVYAQQVLSLISFVMTIITMLYVSLSLVKIKKITQAE